MASGKWLVGRFEEEHPLAACLCMAWIERCAPHTVRNLPPTELMLDYRPHGSPAEQAAECVRLLSCGAMSLSLDGKPHGEAMETMAGLLSVHGCGILLTPGHARVLDKIERPLADGYVITLRDPDTCSARVIRDHREFWEDNAASPDVTPMADDSIHGPGDILIVPPRPLRFPLSPALA
ncbi:hypothetical protein AKI39_00425 [Bordetella sp. H567]|nr:hypothetical protein AKI39_00425 [Bordetella sp. H567]